MLLNAGCALQHAHVQLVEMQWSVLMCHIDLYAGVMAQRIVDPASRWYVLLLQTAAGRHLAIAAGCLGQLLGDTLLVHCNGGLQSAQ